MHRKIFYFLLILSLFPLLLQAGTRGRIKGKVVDLQTGEALIGANVTVVGTTAGSATDASGEFLVQNLEAGVYTIRASYLGYQTITISNIRVNADLTAYVNVELPNEDIQVGTVEIVAQKPLIQKDNTNAVRITTSEDIEAIPARGVNSIIALSPGVTSFNGDIYIRGGRKDEVGYYLEGISITNPMTGGRAVSLNQDALEEIQVQSGGYTAEFGGANAGIIRTSLKTGGSQLQASYEYITDNITFKSRDDAYDGEKRLGAYWYGYNEQSASLSGQLFTDKLKFFINGNYIYQRDDDRQAWSGLNLGWVKNPTGTKDSVYIDYPAGARPKHQRDDYGFTGSLTAEITSNLKLRATGVVNKTTSDYLDDSDLLYVMNDRVGQYVGNNGSFSLKLTHVINPKVFYEITGGYFYQDFKYWDRYLKDDIWSYGDSVANANAGVGWTRSGKDIAAGNIGRYYNPATLNVLTYSFYQPNYVPVSYSKADRKSYTLSGSLSWMIGKEHSFKLGGEYNSYVMRGWGLGLATRGIALSLKNYKAAYPSLSEDEAKVKLLKNNYGVNNYGYDFLGNELDDDEFFGARKPVFAAFYLQDKIEYEDIIINAGLRYDYINIDSKMYKDPQRPDLAVNPDTYEIIPEGWTDVPSFSAVSPRIGVSFPVTNRTVFHAQWGKFVQQPELSDIYRGYLNAAWRINSGYFFGASSGQNVRPTRTTQYEIGFSQELTSFLSFDITGYYKDIKDQVVYIYQSVAVNADATAYASLTNGDFATTKGIEISLTMRRYERLSAQANISFQDAQGTGSFPNSNRGIVGSPVVAGQVYTPVYISPLEYNNGLKANVNLDYRFDKNESSALLRGLGASVLITYSSGHPYTLGDGKSSDIGYSGSTTSDARTRAALEALNASTTPANFRVDLRVDKTFEIFDRLNANIYVQVINLFDKKNVQQVYLKTGSAETDGFLNTPSESAKLIETYGSQYPLLYQGMLNYDGLYGQARQIRLGIRLEY
jgi:hypothetical protein